MSDDNRQIVRKSTLAEQGNEDDLRRTTVEERWNMMWQLTVNAWAMKGDDIAGQEFQRDVERLDDSGAEYLVVGAHALATYGQPRATGDFDIWIRATAENVERVWSALETFGAPRRRLSKADLCIPDTVYQIGIAPYRIDILTSITGVEFDDAWQNRNRTQVNGINVSVISRADLLKNKRATGRPKDIADAIWLEETET
jgi:hypothetical protein